MLFVDGAYTFEHEQPRFHHVAAPTQANLQRLLHAIATRVTRALERQGLLIRDEENPSLDLEPADGFEQLLGAAVHYRIATGPFADELLAVLGWSFRYVQADGSPGVGDLLADGAGGSVYLRLSTRKVDQPVREIDSALERDILASACWMRRPAEGASLAIVYTGAVAPEAMEAHAAVVASNPGAGLLAVTSADRLWRGWGAAQRARRAGIAGSAGVDSPVETLLAPLARDARVVTVINGYPATLGWLGSVRGHRVEPLGVDRFGQSGSLSDLYREHGIGGAILEACGS